MQQGNGKKRPEPATGLKDSRFFITNFSTMFSKFFLCSQERLIWVAVVGYSTVNPQCCVCTNNQAVLNNSGFLMFLLACRSLYAKVLDLVVKGCMSRWWSEYFFNLVYLCCRCGAGYGRFCRCLVAFSLPFAVLRLMIYI